LCDIITGEGTVDHNELAQRYTSWATEDLVRATSVDRGDYLPEALAAMENELSSRDISIERAEIEQDVRKEGQETEERLRGVRGWLLYFVIMVFVGSLIGVVESLNILTEPANSTEVLITIPLLILSLYGFFVFVLLVRKHKTAPSRAAKLLVASAVYTFLLGVLIYLMTGELTIAPLGGAGAVVWLTYLNGSRRVALTYPQESPMSNTRSEVKPNKTWGALIKSSLVIGLIVTGVWMVIVVAAGGWDPRGAEGMSGLLANGFAIFVVLSGCSFIVKAVWRSLRKSRA